MAQNNTEIGEKSRFRPNFKDKTRNSEPCEQNIKKVERNYFGGDIGSQQLRSTFFIFCSHGSKFRVLSLKLGQNRDFSPITVIF